jgi:hypothetical protein
VGDDHARPRRLRRSSQKEEFTRPDVDGARADSTGSGASHSANWRTDILTSASSAGEYPSEHSPSSGCKQGSRLPCVPPKKKKHKQGSRRSVWSSDGARCSDDRRRGWCPQRQGHLRALYQVHLSRPSSSSHPSLGLDKSSDAAHLTVVGSRNPLRTESMPGIRGRSAAEFSMWLMGSCVDMRLRVSSVECFGLGFWLEV